MASISGNEIRYYYHAESSLMGILEATRAICDMVPTPGCSVPVEDLDTLKGNAGKPLQAPDVFSALEWLTVNHIVDVVDGVVVRLKP